MNIIDTNTEKTLSFPMQVHSFVPLGWSGKQSMEDFLIFSIFNSGQLLLLSSPLLSVPTGHTPSVPLPIISTNEEGKVSTLLRDTSIRGC